MPLGTHTYLQGSRVRRALLALICYGVVKNFSTVHSHQSANQEMSQTLHCTNGYKAQYRKDLIPDAMKKAAIPMAMKKGFITGLDEEPSFGLFSTGPDYSLKNGAVVVFACLNPK